MKKKKIRDWYDCERIARYLTQKRPKDNEYVVCPYCMKVHERTSEWEEWCSYNCFKKYKQEN